MAHLHALPDLLLLHCNRSKSFFCLTKLNARIIDLLLLYRVARDAAPLVCERRPLHVRPEPPGPGGDSTVDSGAGYELSLPKLGGLVKNHLSASTLGRAETAAIQVLTKEEALNYESQDALVHVHQPRTHGPPSRRLAPGRPLGGGRRRTRR